MRNNLKHSPLYNIPAAMLKTLIDSWTAKTPKTAKIIQYGLIGAGIASSIIPLFNVPTWAITSSFIITALGTQFLKK